jgi:hypothetical protein
MVFVDAFKNSISGPISCVKRGGGATEEQMETRLREVSSGYRMKG